jgi:DNA-binding transcriptional ArsR family regulator
MCILVAVARVATTSDVFNAVGEPRRRKLLDLLAHGERPVSDLVRELGMAQPHVSKHLRVLRQVGAVAVREDGRRRLYRLNSEALKPIHEWVKSYEDLWNERFDHLELVVNDVGEEERGDGGGDG